MDDVPSPQNDLEVQKYGAYDTSTSIFKRTFQAGN